MNILAINASPRIGGNADVLCDQFLKGASENGHATEKINLGKERMSPCFGCYHCGESKICVHDDCMNEILEKLISADIIVLATPVYFYSMDAQMKIMIDRCLPRYQEIRNKSFYFIITAADPQHSAADETIAGLRGYLRCLPESKEKGIIYGTGAWDKGDVFKLPVLQEAYSIGKSI